MKKIVVFIILPVVVLALGISFVLFFVKEKNKENTVSDTSQKSAYFGLPCKPNASVSFTNDFTDRDKIKTVQPTIVKGESRHRAFLDIDTAKTDKVPVYAPVDSELVNGVYKDAKGLVDYDLHFQVSCEIWYLINHVTEPVEKIKSAFPDVPQTDTKISSPFRDPVRVKAGELLGYSYGTTNAYNFDFAVFDLNHVNEGLPADNGTEYGKEKNFICPFDVLPDEIKKAYYSKIIPAQKPSSNCNAY